MRAAALLGLDTESDPRVDHLFAPLLDQTGFDYTAREGTRGWISSERAAAAMRFLAKTAGPIGWGALEAEEALRP